MRGASERRRLIVCAAAGTAAAGAIAWFVPLPVTVLTGWDTLAVVLLVWVWSELWSIDAAETERLSIREDDTRSGTRLLLVAAAVISLVAVGSALVEAARAHGADEIALTATAVLTVVLSWAVVHTVFALQYAHLYYSEPVGGIDFPGAPDRPCYQDIAYHSFTIGMTFQVSDTEVTTTAMRRVVLRHALLSYLFGTVFVALTINVVVNLAN